MKFSLKINLYHSPTTIFLASVGGKDNRLFIHYTCVIKAANRSKWIARIMLLDVLNKVWFNQVCMVQVWKYRSILGQKLIKNQESSFLSILTYILNTYFCIMQNSQESQNNMMYNKFFNF